MTILLKIHIYYFVFLRIYSGIWQKLIIVLYLHINSHFVLLK